MGALPFLLALVASGLSAWPIFRLLVAAKSRQTISQFAPEGHQVKQGTPTMGGLIVLVGIVCGVGFLASAFATIRPWALSGLVLAVGFGLIGFVDDFVVPRMVKGSRGLGWKQKLLMQILATVLGVAPLFGGQDWTSVGVAVFVILFFSNAYNFSDGLDALAGTILLAFCAGVLGIGMLTGNTFAVQTSLILMCAVIPFLFLNAPPARVFMGDVGSLPIGALLGLIVISLWSFRMTGVSEAKPTMLLPGFTVFDPIVEASRYHYYYISPEASSVVPFVKMLPLLVLSVVMIAELVPGPLQILSVKLRKKKLFPYTPIHHAFEKAGWPETRVTFMFALIQLIASIVAVAMYIPFSNK